ncbi:hypothetical protein [Kitasatospora sp. NPDC094011]|uniref:hypothetical protein n=1 Tax=Kitasatospora sp. NPDC094011 TaxID=3364090 RepID=UPI00382E8CC7
MPDISDLIAAAVPREQAVPVCLDGAGAARLAELEDEAAALDGWQPASLGEVDPRAGLRPLIEQARTALAGATVEFRFRALGHREFSALMAAHPPASGRPELLYDETFLPALLAACCVSPTLSPGQVDQLLDRANHGTVQELFAAALAVNEEPSPLPF